MAPVPGLDEADILGRTLVDGQTAVRQHGFQDGAGGIIDLDGSQGRQVKDRLGAIGRQCDGAAASGLGFKVTAQPILRRCRS